MKLISEVVKIECSVEEVKSGKVAKKIAELFTVRDEKELTSRIMDQYLFEQAEAEAYHPENQTSEILVALNVGVNEDGDDNIVKFKITN